MTKNTVGTVLNNTKLSTVLSGNKLDEIKNFLLHDMKYSCRMNGIIFTTEGSGRHELFTSFSSPALWPF